MTIDRETAKDLYAEGLQVGLDLGRKLAERHTADTIGLMRLVTICRAIGVDPLHAALHIVFQTTGAESIEIHSGDREPGRYITREQVLGKEQ